MTSTLIRRQAVVVGAGVAGLPAARALADYFEHVIVLERDALPLDASHRAGTPQARHTHALLGGGLQAFGTLFPGFDRDLAGNGTVPINVGLDVRIERPGFDPFPQRDFGVPAYAVSRPLIELSLRQRVGQNDNITIRERCRAHDIVTSDDGTAVSAIRFENSEGQSETLAADLVIEASGRGNLTLALLKTIGLTAPEEGVIGVDIGYATAVSAIPDDAPAAWKGVMTLDTLARGGLVGTILPLERNRWIVTLVGRHGDKPPGDRDGFLAYAR